jgi:hypothetical protein
MPRAPRPTTCRPSRSNYALGRCLSAPGSWPPARVRLAAIGAAAFVVVLTRLLLPDTLADAQQPGPAINVPDEYARKAAFLYSFGRYVHWPETCFTNAADPFVIGILGKDSFGGALDEIAANKTIQDRRLVVRRFASLEEYRQPCHILFVSRSLPAEQEEALIAKTQGKPVLVVGETAGFGERGAIANFFVDEERIRFELNIAVARQAQLRLDAKLLSLGKPVGAKSSETPN